MICLLLMGVVQSYPTINLTSIPSTDTVPFRRLYHTMDYNNETNTLVIFGGQRGLTYLYNDVWIFDLNENKYSLLYPTNEFFPCKVYVAQRSNAGCFVDSSTNTLYIYGGLSEKGPKKDLWSFSLSGYQWTRQITTGDVPSSRYRFGYTKFYWDGLLKFAVFGGCLAEGESNSLYILDVESKVWTKMPNKTDVVPPKLNGPSIQYFNGSIFVVTGEETSSDEPYFNGLYRYDLENETWEEISPSGSYTHRYFSGTAIIENILYVLFGWSNSILDDISEINYIDLSTLDKWNSLSYQDCEVRDSFSFSAANNQIYLFGGYSALSSEYLNSLVILSENNSSWTCTEKNTNYEVPPARQYHSMSSINGALYVFGGIGSESILSDMWSLDINQIWKSIDMTGDSPPGRYGHAYASDGDMIYIWGGTSSLGYLNDFYIFTTLNNSWTSINPSGTMPSPKTGACLALNIPNIYIFGGNSNAGLTNELWVYSLSNNTYTLLSLRNPPSARTYTNCEFFNESIWIMLGTGQSELPLGDVHKLDLTTFEWILVGQEAYTPQARSLAVAKHFNSFILLFGGQAWTTDPYLDIFAIDAVTGVFSQVGWFPIYFYAGAFAVIRTTMFISGGGTVMGNTLRLSVPSLSFNYFDLKDLDIFNETCSPGSFYNQVKAQCELCVAGFYSDGYLNKHCTPCPAGTYNVNNGATSQRQCYPCPYGTYSNVTNATYCLQCPVGMSCPIGSTSYSEESMNIITYSSQPDNYSPNNSEINKKKDLIYIIIPSIFLFILLLILILPITRKFIAKIDMYKEDHNYELLKPMYMFKNFTGGLFFLMFILVAAFVISLSVVLLEYDNIIEDKTLLPMAVINEINSNIYGTVTMKVVFSNYGDKCEGKGRFSPLFSIILMSSTIDLTKVRGENYKKEKDCIVDIECLDCQLTIGDKIIFDLQEDDSYCSSISVSITSESSIPNSNSQMETSVTASDYKVFRGYLATEFYFKITPSLFKSYVQEYKDKTGYHVSVDNNPVPGSEYLISEIGFSSGLRMEVNLDINNDGLYTERNYKQTFIIFLTTLLGSVFGIMGAFRGIMRTLENSIINLKQKVGKKSELDDIQNQRNKHKNLLEHEEVNMDSQNEDKNSNTDLMSARV